jgi:hypothetical protein
MNEIISWPVAKGKGCDFSVESIRSAFHPRPVTQVRVSGSFGLIFCLRRMPTARHEA